MGARRLAWPCFRDLLNDVTVIVNDVDPIPLRNHDVAASHAQACKHRGLTVAVLMTNVTLLLARRTPSRLELQRH